MFQIRLKYGSYSKLSELGGKKSHRGDNFSSQYLSLVIRRNTHKFPNCIVILSNLFIQKSRFCLNS